MRFIKWFNTGEGREVNVTREFYEELIKPGFLPLEALINAQFEYIKQEHGRLHGCSQRFDQTGDIQDIFHF